ncbi:hypothetical protein P4284_24025 [Bacillus swezeyi]|uniref:hypothetical protein n=1 Tax=Bacillus swezeyi TaxID=1925020 RepID=UPI002E1C9D42|nr:hypothetical protein [Bacillus swezeyi]MED2979722.1 hypothetical protein [Bacillus swezeyi]
MILENQLVDVAWNPRNKKHFIELGYTYTGLGKTFTVKAEHLTMGSKAIVKVKCDYCNEIKTTVYNNYYRHVIKENQTKYCCKTCSGKKYSEVKSIDNFEFKKCNSRNYKGTIYELTSELDNLNEVQKALVNEVIRFCEENKYFPSEKDMSNKKGYVSRTQYYKHFNTQSFTDIYQFIYPLKKETRNKKISSIQKSNNKPSFFKCHQCKEVKSFDNQNFSVHHLGKYGLKTTCKKCENHNANMLRYRKNGIIFEKFEDIDPIEWWKHYYDGKVGLMPEFCNREENIIKICRFVLGDFLKLNKKELCDNNMLNIELFKKYKIFHLYSRISDRLKFLNLCFPEMNIISTDLSRRSYNDNDILDYLDNWIKMKGLTVEGILNLNKPNVNQKIKSFANTKFHQSVIRLFHWYLNSRQILHPRFDREIHLFDFSYRPTGLWEDKENRVLAIKTYCNDHGIKPYLDNTEKLKKWVKKNFTSKIICTFFDYTKYYSSLYDVLIESFPSIKKDKILFKWEWHQWNQYNKELLVNMMRELVLYRLNIKDPLNIPKKVNRSGLIKLGYEKFNKIIWKSHFDNYYQWCCSAFPEYKSLWQPNDFNVFITSDGFICDSLEEVDIYEFIKNEMKIKHIQPIGVDYKSEHSFVLSNKGRGRWYTPDFVISSEWGKIVYIEYFGMYVENPPNALLKRYKNKTMKKIDYYKNIKEYDFIFLFPEDLKNNFYGVRQKLSHLTISKFPLHVLGHLTN